MLTGLTLTLGRAREVLLGLSLFGLQGLDFRGQGLFVVVETPE